MITKYVNNPHKKEEKETSEVIEKEMLEYCKTLDYTIESLIDQSNIDVAEVEILKKLGLRSIISLFFISINIIYIIQYVIS